MLIRERNNSKIFIDDNQINIFYKQYREILKYDLILLDIRLKKDDKLDDKLDSLVIYEKIRNISKSIPIILITASFDLELHNKISKLDNSYYWIKGAHSKTDFENILMDIVQIKKTIEIALENKNTRNTSILQVEFLIKFIKLRENLRCHTIVDKEFGEKFKFDTDDGMRFLTILDNFLLSIISIQKSIESNQDIRHEIDKLWISTLRVFNYMIAQTDNFANTKIAIFNEFTNNKQTKFHILNKANFDKLNDKRNFYAHRKLNDKPAADNESIMYIDFVLSWFFRQTSNFM